MQIKMFSKLLTAHTPQTTNPSTMSTDGNTDLTAINSTLKAATSYISTSLHDAVKLRLGPRGLSAIKPQTIPQLFRECCMKYAEKPALKYQNQDPSNTWTVVTYADYAREVEQAALLLLHIGLQPRSSIGILAFNCPEWFYAELGALRAGGVVAGIYPSNSAEAVYHVLDTSEATVCIVDDSQQMAKVRAVKGRLPRLRAVVQLHGPYADFVGVDEGYYRWSDLVAMEFCAELREELALREQDVSANECALLIYTSGTVGMPKAVMLSHDSVLFETKAVSAFFLQDIVPGEEVFVSYLPLNHIAAQIYDIFLSIQNGVCTCFADCNALKGTLSRTLQEARPTRFVGVPRVFEKMQEQLNSLSGKSTAFGKFVMEKARQNIERYHLDTMHGKSTSRICYWFSRKVTNRIKIAMGLDRCKSFIIGSAPATVELKRYFLGIDMPLMEIYGMCETSGAITMNYELKYLENVGKPVDGCEIKIYSPDQNGYGEICIRCRSNFMGYLNDLMQTKEIIKDDGWLYSGDMGYLDIEGNLYVSGRIKELVITAAGENIPPIYIEESIKREISGISNALLIGDHRKYLTVLLTIKTKFDDNTGLPIDKLSEEAIDWLHTLGLDYTLLSEVLSIPSDMRDVDASTVTVTPHPKVVKAIQAGLERANAKAISYAQRVQKFSILPHDFSIATGELGPTLKMRRNIVLQKYANVIDSMYK